MCFSAHKIKGTCKVDNLYGSFPGEIKTYGNQQVEYVWS